LDAHSNRLDSLIQGDTGRATVRLLANLVQREALVLTYNDALMVIGGVFVAAVFVMPFVRRPRSIPVSPEHGCPAAQEIKRAGIFSGYGKTDAMVGLGLAVARLGYPGGCGFRRY